MTRKLTGKQQAFVVHYFATNFNATQAAKAAGYKGSYTALGVIGHENLKNPKVRAAIAQVFEEYSMAPEEVLGRLMSMSRGELPTRITEGPMGKSETFDSKGALELIGKYQELFRDRVEHTGKDGGPLTIRIIYGDSDGEVKKASS